MTDAIDVERAAGGGPPPAPRRRAALIAAAVGAAALGGALVAPALFGDGSGLDLIRSVETVSATTVAPDRTTTPSTRPSEPDAGAATPGSVSEIGDEPPTTTPTFVEIGDGDGSTGAEFDLAADGDGLAPARRERHSTPTDPNVGDDATAPPPSIDVDTTFDDGATEPAPPPTEPDAQPSTELDTTVAPTGDATATTTESAPSTAPATSIVPDEVADAASGTGDPEAGVAAVERPAEASIIGSIAFPSLGLDYPLREGIQQSTIDLGPSHWPGTAMPGEVGNVVIAGHRTSHGGPFRHLHELENGDVVSFDQGDGPVDYVMVGSEIVGPDALWIVDPTDSPTATLFSCHPLGSTAQRIVIHLELVE